MSVKSNPPDNSRGGEKENCTTLLVCGIAEPLKTKFKLHCVREGVSMSEVLVEAIRRLVEND